MDLTKITKEEWDDLYSRLLAFAPYWLKEFFWFRQTSDESYAKGYQPKDYVMRAIKFHLEHPEKFDPSKRSFLSYLKNHVIRYMVRDDSESKDNTTTTDSPSDSIKAAVRKRMGDETDASDWRELVSAENHHFDGEMDIPVILQEIRDALAQDPDALAIFEGISTGLSRPQVIESHGWTEGQYNNTWKRMERHRKRIADRYHLKARNLKK